MYLLTASLQGENVEAQRCSRCGLPVTWGISLLDKHGVCNYCNYYDTIKDKLRDFDRWQELFKNHLDTYKGKYKYDAVVGFSGGKDSSYIVYMLKKQYNCNVLAVTVNFGFMPTMQAIENSRRVALGLGVDHIIFDATSPEIKDAFAEAAAKGKICGLCTGLCTAFTRKMAIEHQVPFYVMGADRGQLFRDLSPENGPLSGAGAIARMLTPYSEEKTRRSDNPQRSKQMRKWLSQFGLNPDACQNIYPDPQSLPSTNAFPLSLQFFLFHPYNEKEIKHILQQEVNWRLPEKDHLHAHHDCLFHDSITYFTRSAVKTTITTGEICVDVREGEIEQKEALQALQIENEKLDNMEKPYAVFREQFGIEEEIIKKAEKKFRKRINFLRKLRKFQLLFIKPKLKKLDDL